MENSLPVLAEYEYDKIGSFRMSNPYTIAFCYVDPSRFNVSGKDSFVLKGGYNDVKRRIEKMNIPMLVFKTFWRHGRSRSLWPSFYNFENWARVDRNPFFYPLDPKRDRKTGKRYHRRWRLSHAGRTWFIFRRVPRKWIPEYNELLTFTD